MSETKHPILNLNGHTLVDQDARDAAAQSAAAAAANATRISELSEEMTKRPTSKPRVYIDGVIPTTKDDVLAELTYEHGPERWHAYITIKCQGSSSMAYPKKNFTIKLYSDEARTVKLKKKMFGWPVAQYKYVLKANWIDHTHARNIVTARLWSEVVASRPDYNSLPEELRNSPNNGAIDGYPIVVYTNGTYQGLYTWNIGKDDWMWGMDEDNPNHVLMCAETNTNGVYRETPCNFRALWSGVHDQDWSVEVGTNSEAVKNSLNALITCVKDTDDATFKATIGNHLDVMSAIDYYLLTCADCGIDSLGRNLLIGTYDLKKWYCGKYDLDSTWLLWWDGYKFIPVNTDCPVDYQECFSLLWSRIRTVFWEELKDRGFELRRSVLTYANIVGHFERFCASIGSETYADDIVAYSTIPSAATNNIWQIRNGVRDRLVYFDAWLDSIQPGVSCEGVAINNDGESNILRREQKNLSTTVMPPNTTEQVIWSSSDEKTIQIDRKTGKMTAVDVGSAVITAVCGKCASSIKMNVISNGEDVLYRLQNEATLDGTRATCIDTGVKIVDADKDFTIAIDVTPAARNGDTKPRYLYQNNNTMYGGKNPGFRMASMAWPYLYGFTSTPNQSADVEILSIAKDDTAERSVIVVRHVKGSGEASVTSCYKGITETKTGAMPDGTFLDANCNNLWIGANSAHSEFAATYFFVGTVHRCDVYNYVLSDDEVTAFIDGMN